MGGFVVEEGGRAFEGGRGRRRCGIGSCCSVLGRDSCAGTEKDLLGTLTGIFTSSLATGKEGRGLPPSGEVDREGRRGLFWLSL